MWAQDQVLAAALSIQFAIKVPGKAAERGLTYWTPAPTWKKCLAPDFAAIMPWCAIKDMDQWMEIYPSLPHSLTLISLFSHSTSLSHTLSVSKLVFQIQKSLRKEAIMFLSQHIQKLHQVLLHKVKELISLLCSH